MAIGNRIFDALQHVYRRADKTVMGTAKMENKSTFQFIEKVQQAGVANPLLTKGSRPAFAAVPLGGVLSRRPVATAARFFTTSNICKGSPGELKDNPFFEKYASKISQKIDTCPESVHFRVKDDSEKNRRRPEPTQPAVSNVQRRPTSAFEQTRPKLLEDVLKLELIQGKSAADISQIWIGGHFNKDGCVSAVIPAETFEAECILSAVYPLFLLPVPREQGIEFFVVQRSRNETHFTSLLSYQTHGENAPPCLSLSYYADLSASHEIILMRGEYDVAVLKPLEVQCLVNQLQLYYNKPDAIRQELLETFNRRPAEFQHMRVVEEMMRVGAQQHTVYK